MEPENIIVAVILICVLIIAWYVMYPLYFESTVLMKIPEYRILKETLAVNKKKLAANKKDLATLHNTVNRLKSNLSTSAKELLASNEQLANLERTIALRTAEIQDNAVTIADLMAKLDMFTKRATSCRRLRDASTQHLREFNDLMLKEYSFKDDVLLKKLQRARDTLLLIFVDGKTLGCGMVREQILSDLSDLVSEMWKNTTRTNQLCDLRGNGFVKGQINQIRSEIFGKRQCSPEGNCSVVYDENAYPLQDNLEQLFEDVESVITHLIANKFCSPSGFQIEVFEKFVKDLLYTTCGTA